MPTANFHRTPRPATVPCGQTYLDEVPKPRRGFCAIPFAKPQTCATVSEAQV
jgi:hypothetical protein